MANGALPTPDVHKDSKHDPEVVEMTRTISGEEPPVTTDLESQKTQATVTLKQDELYSAFSKKQRIFIVIMTTLGAIISPISSAI